MGETSLKPLLQSGTRFQHKVMNVRFSTEARNGVAYKDKWGAFARDFKRSMSTK